MRHLVSTLALLLTIGCGHSPLSPSADFGAKPRGTWQDLQGDQLLLGSPGVVSFTLTNSAQTQNYLWDTSVPRTLTGSVAVTFTVTTMSGVPAWFSAEPGCSPDTPEARVFILHDWSGSDFGRWWAHLPVVLASGTFTISASLSDLSIWSAVFGETATAYPTQFASALQRPLGVGLTFGNDCFYGHGVGVNGGVVQFTVNSLSIG